MPTPRTWGTAYTKETKMAAITATTRARLE